MSCWRSQPSFTVIWGSAGSVPKVANTEFPALHNHRFPLGKWRFTALKCINFSSVFPLPSGGLPSLLLPQDHLSTSHETPQTLALFVFTYLTLFTSPVLFVSLHPSLHWCSQPDFLYPPCRHCPCLHMLFVIHDTCFFMFMLPHK